MNIVNKTELIIYSNTDISGTLSTDEVFTKKIKDAILDNLDYKVRRILISEKLTEISMTLSDNTIVNTEDNEENNKP